MNIHEKIERLREYGFEGHPSVVCREYRGELEWFFEGDGPDSVVRCDAPDGLALYADALVDWMRERGYCYHCEYGPSDRSVAYVRFTSSQHRSGPEVRHAPKHEAIIDAALEAVRAKEEE